MRIEPTDQEVTEYVSVGSEYFNEPMPETPGIFVLIVGLLVGFIIVYGPILIQNYIPMYVTYPISAVIFVLLMMQNDKKRGQYFTNLRDRARGEESVYKEEEVTYDDGPYFVKSKVPYDREAVHRALHWN